MISTLTTVVVWIVCAVAANGECGDPGGGMLVETYQSREECLAAASARAKGAELSCKPVRFLMFEVPDEKGVRI
jgi:hypothetical protein